MRGKYIVCLTITPSTAQCKTEKKHIPLRSYQSYSMSDTHYNLHRAKLQNKTLMIYPSFCKYSYPIFNTFSYGQIEKRTLFRIFLPLSKLAERGIFHFQGLQPGRKFMKVIYRKFCNLHDNYYLYHQNNNIKSWIIYRQPY